MILRKYQLWKVRTAEITCSVFFLAIMLHEGLCNTIVLSTWKVPVAWQYLFLHDWGFPRLLFRTCLGIMGTISLLALVEHLVRLFQPIACLAPFGTTTMGVYIVHERPFELFVKYLPSLVPLPSWTRVLLAISCFFVCHYIISAIRSHAKSNFLIFGNEEWLSHFYHRFLIFPIHWSWQQMRSIYK